MSVGKNIYELRTAKNLSQGELADLLDVSRQSVSKWETDAAVPDLDKLMKLCDIFEVSLDEITGRQPKEAKEPVIVVEKQSQVTTQKIIGLILLTVSLLGGILLLLLADTKEATYIATPILLAAFAASLICLFVKEHAGYWCGWAALTPLAIFTPYVMGMPIVGASLITQIVFFAAMIFVINKVFANTKLTVSKRRTALLIAGWLVYILLHFLSLKAIAVNFGLYPFGNCILWDVMALLETYTVCYIKELKKRD